jgi:Xaa-Pro aminopeptidase
MTSAAEHRERTRAAMAAAGIDVLVLGREANARYVSGANRLWLAGTRPFAPSCVLVGETGAVHLLSVTDDGVPVDVRPANLYPISWNPMNLVAAAAVATAGTTVRTLGVDGMSPLFAQLLAAVYPDAELADGEALLRDVRRTKTAGDLVAIRAAVGVAEDALAAVAAAGPTTGAVGLAGAFVARMGQLGVTTPAFPPAIDVVEDRVSARVGVLRSGWAGVLARTWPDDGGTRAAAAAGVAAGRPGARVSDVTAAGVTVDGLGMGHEALRADDVLGPGMVVYVEARGDGAVWGETVVVTDDGPDALTTSP